MVFANFSNKNFEKKFLFEKLAKTKRKTFKHAFCAKHKTVSKYIKWELHPIDQVIFARNKTDIFIIVENHF
jgi:hypothetical protein